MPAVIDRWVAALCRSFFSGSWSRWSSAAWAASRGRPSDYCRLWRGSLCDCSASFASRTWKSIQMDWSWVIPRRSPAILLRIQVSGKIRAEKSQGRKLSLTPMALGLLCRCC